MAQIVHSPAGLPWVVSDDGRSYDVAGQMNFDRQVPNFASGCEIVAFMEREGWLTELSLVSAAVRRCSEQQPTPSIDYSESRIRVCVDEVQCVMILVHLIKNAREATASDGEVAISVVNDGERARI